MNNDNWGQSYKLDNDKNAIGQLSLDKRGQEISKLDGKIYTYTR